MTRLGTTTCLAIVATALATAISATPAQAAAKTSTQVRSWSTSTHTTSPGATATFTVKVTSGGRASAGRTVRLQRYTGGTWRTSTQVRSSKYGNAVLRLRVGTKAGVTHRVRVAVAATRTRAGKVTPARKVVVRAPRTASANDRRLLTLVNEARSAPRKCGAKTYGKQPPLTWNARLDEAAQGHATDMASRNYFRHTGKDGSSVADRVTRRGYAWRAVGENIAAGQPTPDAVMAAWLASEGHCRNIMSGAFTQLGTGTSTNTSSKYRIYWVQNFGAPR